MKILILGYYGFGNRGDEAILMAILKELEIRSPKSQPMVLYPAGETLKGVKTIPRDHLPTLVKELYNSDVLLCGGGSLLQDVTSKRSLLYYLGIIALALLLKKKVLLIGQGIGPIHSWWGKFLTAKILNRLPFVGLRDGGSLKQLHLLGVKDKKIQLGADLTLLLHPIGREKARELLEQEGFPLDKRGLALSLRPWQEEEYYWLLLPYIKAFSQEVGLVPVFFPLFPKEDLPLGERLMGHIRGGVLIRGAYGPQEIMGMMGEMEMVVGVRLHALIFAASSLTPFVGISYDPKIQGFLRLFNREVATSVTEGDGEALYEELWATYRGWKEKRGLMEKRLKALKLRVQTTWELVERELTKNG